MHVDNLGNDMIASCSACSRGEKKIRFESSCMSQVMKISACFSAASMRAWTQVNLTQGIKVYTAVYMIISTIKAIPR